jgi:hypothetical protein
MMAPGAPGARGGFGASENKAVNDFSTASKAAESFLSALESKDPERLADAVALRSQHEAENKHKPIFTAILEKSADSKQIDELARDFGGMKVMGIGTPKGSGLISVIVGKEEEKSASKITLFVRKEKAGWKVQDFGKKWVQKYPGQAKSPLGAGGNNRSPGGY